MDLVWILVVQCTSYAAGAISWVFAERAGMRAFGLYIARFARDNRHYPTLLGDRHAREQVEPFLTSETFHTIYKLMYEVEGQLKVLLSLIFNAIVLGAEIDGALPLAYATVFIILVGMQYFVRNRVTEIYLDSQRWNNRVTAHGYTAWDNVFSGNKYNLRLWFKGFKYRARECLKAAIRVIVAREGLSAVGAIIGLTIVFTTLTYIAFRDAGDTAILIGLAATLPRQIDMTNEVHQLAIDYQRCAGGLDPRRRHCREHASRARSAFQPPHQVRPAGAAREAARSRSSTSIEDAMRLLLGDADRPRQCARRQRLRQVDAAGRAQGRDQEPRLLLADHRPARLRVRAEGARCRRGRGSGREPKPQGPQAQGLFVRRTADQVAARRSSSTPTRRSICSTNGTPISTPRIAPPPMRWSRNWPARARVIEISHRDAA